VITDRPHLLQRALGVNSLLAPLAYHARLLAGSYDWPVRYVLSNKWSLTEHFVITDKSGNQCFDVRGNLGFTQRLSFRDQAGHEVAEISKHLMTTTHDIIIGGQRVAEVRHTGFFGEHYDIDSTFGLFTAKGSFSG